MNKQIVNLWYLPSLWFVTKQMIGFRSHEIVLCNSASVHNISCHCFLKMFISTNKCLQNTLFTQPYSTPEHEDSVKQELSRIQPARYSERLTQRDCCISSKQLKK